MSKRAITLVIAFTMLAVMTASAETYDIMASSLGRIDAAYADGEIDYDHAVTYKYLAFTTGAEKYVPAHLLGNRYSPGVVSGTPAVVELRDAWPYLSADCKAMVAEFHEWGPNETWGATTWRPVPWGNTSYKGREKHKYGQENFWITWITEPLYLAGQYKIHIYEGDYDHPDNPYNGDDYAPWPYPIPDTAYFADYYYQNAFDAYDSHGWYDFSDTEYEEWFPLKDYYADYDSEEEGDQSFPGGDYDYGYDDRADVYLGFIAVGTGGVTYLDTALPLIPWNAYSAYCAQPVHNPGSGDQADPDWDGYVDWTDGSFNDPEAFSHEWMHATEFMYDGLEVSPTITNRWYLEATSMWAELIPYPAPNPYGYLRDSLARWGSYLGDSTITLGSHPDNGYTSNIINFFFEDWSSRDWMAPDWNPPPADPGYSGEAYTVDNNIVREMWRALSGSGDPFFTGDETTDRNTYEAFDYILSEYNQNTRYMTDVDFPAWGDAYHTFASWNWFMGPNDDGNHYRYGANSTSTGAHRMNIFYTGDYPIDPHWESSSQYDPISFFGHGYLVYENLSTDATVGNWDAAVCGFYGKPEEIEASKFWRGGAYFTSDAGANWGNVAGTQGLLEPTFDVGEYSILRVENPSQYDTISYLLANTASAGTGLGIFSFFEEAEESTPPELSVSFYRPELNPDYLEVIVGANEDIFGFPKIIYDIDYSGIDDEFGTIAMDGDGNASPRSFTGTYVIPTAASGTGTLDYTVADVNGNLAAGQLNISVGYVSSSGGVVGDDPAFIRIPAGGVQNPVHISIVSLNDFIDDSADKATLNAGTTVLNNVNPLIAADTGSSEVFGTAYDFGPVWANLKEDAYVTLNYGDLDVGREEYLSVYRYTGGDWEDLGGVIDKSHKRVIAETDSLGIFALGYGEKKSNIGNPNAPKAYALYQNYPNPAVDVSIVKYALPKPAHTSIKVYDIKGRVVDVLVDEAQETGEYSITVDTGNMANGVYLYRMETDDFSAVKKMVIAH